MNKLNGKTLKYAVMHFPIFVPNVGQFGPTLSSIASGASKPLKMTVDGEFIHVETEDKNRKLVEISLPLTSFTHMVADK